MKCFNFSEAIAPSRAPVKIVNAMRALFRRSMSLFMVGKRIDWPRLCDEGRSLPRCARLLSKTGPARRHERNPDYLRENRMAVTLTAI